MKAPDKYQLFLPLYSDVDYKSATEIIIDRAIRRESFGVSALAVHGLMESIGNSKLSPEINKIDLIVPDGQPIRWALNSFYKLGMKDRVYGPELTLKVLEKASEEHLNIFLFGSTEETLDRFRKFIYSNFNGCNIVGFHVDRFRDATPEEDQEDIDKIQASNAHIVLVGRGCPRQEIWVSGHVGKINCVMMAVGAAFDFHAGTVKQAPKWMQKWGLEWLFRLIQEPQRLWKRYLITNTLFILKFLEFKLKFKKPQI